MTQAIGVGVGLIVVLLASLYFDIRIFVALVAIVIGAGMWELARAVTLRGIRIPLIPLWVGGAGMMVSAWVAGPSALLMAFALTCGAVLVWRVVDGGGLEAVRDASTTMFVAAYLPFLASFAVLIARRDDGPWAVLAFVAIVVASDTGGYIAGVLFGKHPMSPSISPKKSWEGFAGSQTLAIIVGIAFALFALDLPFWVGALMGLCGVLAGTIGDLGESLIKRDLGLKDMGTVLPGHGGIMDRLDSLLATVPVVYLVLELLS
ncbi:phosphatidate cytidylyltransferase [Bowdeniella nasicola]|uniref:Phosphatidate cytidylyltransferase n=1 Tax=Bowdeniella nasicola TaxID=208480 RepID=A0A1Q5Q5Y2_9ACTO|nr:phosphatidate cytidylyltransferase [Bowdeniella nasicola]